MGDFIAILDTETSALSPDTGVLLEWAVALWHVPTASMMQCSSYLVRAEANAAEAVNGIPVPLLAMASPLRLDRLRAWLTPASVVVAWNAPFDRQWFPPDVLAFRPWVCAMDDIEWPKSTKGSLVGAALAHGLGVASAHRAISDVLLLCNLFSRVAETNDVAAMIMKAQRPRRVWRALVSYDTNPLAKANGFTFNGDTKFWTRRIADEDAPTVIPALPFKCVAMEQA